MAAISGFSYNILRKRKVDALTSYYEITAELSYGNGSDTYPTGGIPVDREQLGVPNEIQDFQVFDSSSDGYMYKFDSTNSKLKLFGGGFAVNDESLEVGNSVATQSSLIVVVKGY